MPTSIAERTVLVRPQNRLVFIDAQTTTSSKDRTVTVEKQNRFVFINKRTDPPRNLEVNPNQRKISTDLQT